MGIKITELKLYDGAITVGDLYANIRDMRITKNDNKYEVGFICRCYKGSTLIRAMHVGKTCDTNIVKDAWVDCYNILKEYLTEKGITFVDEEV